MRSLLSRILLLVAGTALGIVLLVYLLHSVNLSQVGNDLQHVSVAYLLLAIPFFLTNLLLKVPRWALLFGRAAPDWDTLFGAMNVGYAVNALLPARLGEIVRAYWIRNRSGVGMVQTLSTIAVERVTDGVTLIILFGLMVPTVALPATLLGPAVAIGAVFILVFVLLVALAVLATREGHPLSRFLRALELRWPRVGEVLRQALAGLQVLANRRSLILMLGYTVTIWATNVILIWLVVHAFHIQIPITAAILLTAVLNLGMAVPSSPGYIGWYEYLMVLVLGLYGVQETPALAAAFVFHAIAFVPVSLIGLIYIARTGLETTLHLIRMSASRTAQG